MEVLGSIGWLALGVVLLYWGAEWLVAGSREIALRMGISPLVVGLTVVAFGTSAPELVVSVQANLQDPPLGELAVGNIVGSNICNIALILAVAALVRPLRVHLQVVRREMPILLAVSLVAAGMLWDRTIDRWEGVVLFAGILGYVWLSIRLARKEPERSKFEGFEGAEVETARHAGAGRILRDFGLIVVGLGALIYGADRLVAGGSAIARAYGVSEAVIGLSLLALGTSLPELATSVVAAARHQSDLIIGNALGSCLFNLLCVLGLAALILPLRAPGLEWVDLWVMLGLTLVVLPLLWLGMRLSRLDGVLLLAAYAAYIAYLALRNGGAGAG